MGIWIWVLFGFVAGLVAAEILYLVFRRGPSPEPEVVEDDTPAQLARAQAKTAVLEDRLRVEEEGRAQLRASLEVENQEKLEAASMAYGERLTAAEADYSQKLEAAESQHQENMAAAEVECQAKLKAAEDQYRERLALLKLQFDNLESAFAAAELADEDETGSSAGAVLAGAATAVVVGALAGDEDLDSDADETDFDGEGLEAGDAAGAERMPGSAALAAAAAAVLAVDEDEEEDADVDVEPDKLLTGAEQEIDELLPADVETTLVEGGAATSLAELERLEASKAEQASAAVQYAYDLQDEAEAALAGRMIMQRRL